MQLEFLTFDFPWLNRSASQILNGGRPTEQRHTATYEWALEGRIWSAQRRLDGPTLEFPHEWTSHWGLRLSKADRLFLSLTMLSFLRVLQLTSYAFLGLCRDTRIATAQQMGCTCLNSSLGRQFYIDLSLPDHDVENIRVRCCLISTPHNGHMALVTSFEREWHVKRSMVARTAV